MSQSLGLIGFDTCGCTTTAPWIQDAAKRLLHKGFAPGSGGSAHTEAVEDALALLREWYSSRNNDTGQTKPSRFHEILLKQCEEHKLPSLAALTVFKNLCDAALPRNELAYGHVLRVLCNNGQPPGVVDDLDVAVKVLKKMEEEGYTLTSDEFDHVICGFAAHGQLDSALETADYAVFVDIVPTLDAFVKVLQACETSGDLRVASEMFKLLDAAEIPPTGLCYQSLLRTAIAAADSRFSAKVWRTMLTEGHAGENVLELCAELLNSFGKAGPSAAPLLDKVWDTLEVRTSELIQRHAHLLPCGLASFAVGERWAPACLCSAIVCRVSCAALHSQTLSARTTRRTQR